MINPIKNMPETVHNWLYQTDKRYQSLMIQLEHAKQTENDDEKEIVLQTIYTEFGKEFA
tara:strand:+ start:106 stop:282 length:177 start_codon:yes stop_codon:yes gene_type:complete